MTTISGLACMVVGIILTIELGFIVTLQTRDLFVSIHLGLILFFLLDFGFRFLLTRHKKRHVIVRSLDIVLVLPIVGMLVPDLVVLSNYYFVQAALILVVIGRYGHINHVFRLLRFNPAQIFIIGFMMSIFIGALLLSLPISRVVGGEFRLIDSIFTATSAICVTGLVVKDTGQFFTGFGQAVILGLIQIGGLGIMTFYVLITLFMDRKMSQGETKEYQSSWSTSSLKETLAIIKSIVKFTLMFELVGMGLLFLFWQSLFTNKLTALYYSMFHAVSAFCNAGFSLFPDSLMGFVSNTGVILTISGLIIMGGIGFPVIFELNNYSFFRKSVLRLHVQTKFPILITVVLIVVGTLFILAGEYNAALDGLLFGEKVLMSFFHSVSARTAGFNALDLTTFSSATLLVILLLMFIGASPGSTGGGIKTTTFGVLLYALWNTVQSRSKIELYGRTITTVTVMKAMSIIMLFLLVIMMAFYGLLLTEILDFFPVMFETVSAMGTVGYSLDTTRLLTDSGKWIVIALMFFGRVGPLTIAFALARKRSKPNYKYPEEQILLG
ncbi:hypothetical protein HOH87_01455 [bacterium]|nr:hypothetical protein [bacterium]